MSKLKRKPAESPNVEGAGAAAQGLLKISVPYFPGWTAMVDGNPCPVARADHALMGVAVPAGERELRLRYWSNYFGRGAAVSALALGVLPWPVVRCRKADAPAG